MQFKVSFLKSVWIKEKIGKKLSLAHTTSRMTKTQSVTIHSNEKKNTKRHLKWRPLKWVTQIETHRCYQRQQEQLIQKKTKWAHR